MSVDGPGLFADDDAHDVRSLFREFIGEGKSSAAATDLLITQWEGLLDDPDHASPFWLALAATQWKLGRLEARVKEKALSIIDDGSDLQRFAHIPSGLKKRKAVLERLREQLVSPVPPPKKVKPPDDTRCTWEPGEIFAYKLSSGKFLLFRLSGISEPNPVFELLDWIGDTIPCSDEILSLPVKLGKQYRFTEHLDWGTTHREIRWEPRFMLSPLKARSPYQKRLTRLNIRKEGPERTLPCICRWWKDLEVQLADQFGLIL